ncbi:hypothetical protein D3C76_1207860 [compost metagenome]
MAKCLGTATKETERRAEKAGSRLAYLDANQILNHRVGEVLELELAGFHELGDAIFQVAEGIGEQLLRLASYVRSAIKIVLQGS